VDLFVRNTLERHPTSIHWHGILLPANMDGVPGLSFNGIGPGETYHYHFQLKQSAPTGTTAIRCSRSRPACTAR
jgi:FtsP/CotA-like multicopper oxidase with cupredoxin domain